VASIKDTSKLLNKWTKSVETANQQFEKMSSTFESLNQSVKQTIHMLEQMHKHIQSISKILGQSNAAGQKGDESQARKFNFKQIFNALRPSKIRDYWNQLNQASIKWYIKMDSFYRKLSDRINEMKKKSLGENFKSISKSLWGSLKKVPQIFVRATKGLGKGIAALWQRVMKALFTVKNPTTGALTPLKNMASQALSIQNLKSAMAFSDNYMNSLARISAVNDGTQSNEELQAKILEAANRSRGRYFDMADHVAKLGLTAPQAFSSNDEMIRFAELSQKAFRLGGAGAAEQQSGMEQLINAMGAGGLQGNDFQTIMNTAPMIAESIAKFTGKSMDELMAMSAEGLITADIIKGALFTAADDINGKFGELPMTFGDLWNQISNNAITSFGPVIERVSQFLNSADGQQMVAGISQAIHAAAAAIGTILDGIAAIASFVTDNWSKIEPILIAVGTVWLGVIIFQLWTMVPPLLAQAAAWLAINWPILLVIAVIALVIYALVRLGATAEQIVGAIFGAFAFLGAVIWNTIVGVTNGIIQFLWTSFIEPFLGIFEWFFNAINGGFNGLGGAVANLFGQIISWALSLGKVLSKVIDAIFGTDWTGELEKLQDKVLSWGKDEDAITIDRDAPTIGETIDPLKAWDKGREFGENLASSVQNALDGFGMEKVLNLSEEKDPGDNFTIPGDNTATLDKINKVNEVGRINDTVDISSEDLKMMRELAEMNAIQNFVSLTPTVNVQTGDIRNGYDVDTIIARIEQSLTEQIASSAQGVYGLG